MTATMPKQNGDRAPLTMFGPDFPFAFDDYAKHPAGLGTIPAAKHGTEVAIVGAGISGIVTAFELMKLGLKPVIYEADRIGGRLRSEPVKGVDADSLALKVIDNGIIDKLVREGFIEKAFAKSASGKP